MKMDKWIPINFKRPEYGVPVLIVVGDIAQSAVYMRDGADDTEDWFELFNYKNHECSFFIHDVAYWMPLPNFP